MADRNALIKAALLAATGGAVLAKEGPEGLANFGEGALSSIENVRRQRTREAQTDRQRRIQERALALDEEKNAREAEKILIQGAADKKIGQLNTRLQKILTDPLSKEGGYLSPSAKQQALALHSEISVLNPQVGDNILSDIDRLSRKEEAPSSDQERHIRRHIQDIQFKLGRPLNPSEEKQASDEAIAEFENFRISAAQRAVIGRFQDALRLGEPPALAKIFALTGKTRDQVIAENAQKLLTNPDFSGNEQDAFRMAKYSFDLAYGLLPPEQSGPPSPPSGETTRKEKKKTEPGFLGKAGAGLTAVGQPAVGQALQQIDIASGIEVPEKPAAGLAASETQQRPTFNSIEELKAWADANVKDEKLKQKILSEGGRRFKVKKKTEGEK